MRLIATAAILGSLIASGANAQDNKMTVSPSDGWTVTNYYKQPVYDAQENKIGSVDDVLIDKQGKVTALILGVGGFLGVGEKDVSLPFSAVKMTKKNDKWWLTVNETKDSLIKAPGYKYDSNTTTWVIHNK